MFVAFTTACSGSHHGTSSPTSTRAPSTNGATASTNSPVCRGCDVSEHDATGVFIVDQTHLTVGVGCPSDTARVRLDETATEVRIHVAYAHPTLLDCLQTQRETLRAPLGVRRIVDAKSAKLLSVSEDDRCAPAVVGRRCDGIAVGSPAVALPLP
jgi:hypothetical protein